MALSGGSEWWLVVALSGGSRPMVVVRGGGKGLLSGGSWWLVVASGGLAVGILTVRIHLCPLSLPLTCTVINAAFKGHN